MGTLPDRTLAAVTDARRHATVRELPIPSVGHADGILMVEGSGVCGSDVRWFDDDVQNPRVMGHETVGVIAAAGRGARDRWGFGEGDRVVLEEYLPCGYCRFCRSAEFRYCMESDASTSAGALRYGSTGLDVAPSLWGGFSRYQYLHERTVMHAVPDGLDATLATLALPMANGYEWAHVAGGIGPGGSILIIGPGQQGLGCVLASSVAGASEILVAGLPADEDRLALARSLGASRTLTEPGEELLRAVLAATGGEGVDVVVDTATGASPEFALAVRAVRKGGRVVLPVRRAVPMDGAPLNLVSQKALTIVGVRGHGFQAVETALALIAERQDALRPLSTMTAGLDSVAEAILATGGTGGVRAVHVTVLPGLETGAVGEDGRKETEEG